MYIDLSALPLTLLKRFDTNVHTVITSMQKKSLILAKPCSCAKWNEYIYFGFKFATRTASCKIKSTQRNIFSQMHLGMQLQVQLETKNFTTYFNCAIENKVGSFL